MNEKGSSSIILIVLALILVGVEGYFLIAKKPAEPVVVPNPAVTPTPAPVTPVPVTPEPAPSGGSSSSSQSDVIMADEKSNGKTIHMSVGQSLELDLHNTYWEIESIPKSAVISLVKSSVMVDPPGVSCVPGQGCGVVQAVYRARTAGTVTLHASRSTCGEALRCSPEESKFSVTVVVR